MKYKADDVSVAYVLRDLLDVGFADKMIDYFTTDELIGFIIDKMFDGDKKNIIRQYDNIGENIVKDYENIYQC